MICWDTWKRIKAAPQIFQSVTLFWQNVYSGQAVITCKYRISYMKHEISSQLQTIWCYTCCASASTGCVQHIFLLCTAIFTYGSIFAKETSVTEVWYVYTVGKLTFISNDELHLTCVCLSVYLRKRDNGWVKNYKLLSPPSVY